jgi:6-phosphogluconolactonase
MATVDVIENVGAGVIADWLDACISSALEASNGVVAITVPGGSTPFPIMQQLVMSDLDWSRLAVWPGDDRMVPEDHEASNTGKVRALFEAVGARVQALDQHVPPPHFALAWLGMGEDGHIASLFPNAEPRADDPMLVRRLTPDPLPLHAPFDRITLTIPALLNSDALLFTLGGSQVKRQVFDAAARAEHDLPIARLLGAATQPVTCFA